jgi:hypothetical protein
MYVRALEESSLGQFHILLYCLLVRTLMSIVWLA